MRRRLLAVVAAISIGGVGHAETRRQPKKRPAPKAPKPAPEPAPEPPPAPPAPTTYSGVWKTNISVVLRAKPGERAKAIVTLAAGTEVKVEAEEGRWLKVRVGSNVGYLTRTTITETTPPAPPPDLAVPTTPTPAVEPPPPSRKWSSERTAAAQDGSGLYVGVTAAHAVVRSEPAPTAATVFAPATGTRLAVIDVAAGWIKVRDDAGHLGWIARAEVDNSTAGVAITGSIDASDRPTPVTEPTLRAPAGALQLSAAIGYRSLGMDFSSNGASGLSNYLVSADAAAADLGVDFTTRIGRRLQLGADARMQLASSSPGSGIEYTGPTRAGGDIPFRTMSTDVGVRAGTRVGSLVALAARTGFHYDVFFTKDVSNAARLPREQLVGLTAGARVDLVPPRSRVDVALHLDVLAYGKRGQTSGLEDGTSSDAGAVWAGATIHIALRRRLSVISAYDFGRVTTSWSGMSVRFSDVTVAKRVDSTQTVQLGIAAGL